MLSGERFQSMSLWWNGPTTSSANKKPYTMRFLVVLFGLAIAWGWLMHRTGSLWGSALFHAGADLLIILPIFSSLGAA
jgi:membrane protease YdiL (CAAX protease family)